MKFLLSMLVGIGFAIMYLLNDIRMELEQKAKNSEYFSRNLTDGKERVDDYRT